MSAVILKYNAGNITSVVNALNRIGKSGIISDDPKTILGADRVIFPGVGEASTAMAYLRNRGLDQVITQLRQPVLGICLGLQLMCSHSEENDTLGLGIFASHITKFDNNFLTVPHLGWNQLNEMKGVLFDGVEEGSYVYYVHSYFAPLVAESVARTSHGRAFSAALEKDNFYGVQFHPEKSAKVGEIILKNFFKL